MYSVEPTTKHLKIKKSQYTGIYEKDILCRNCDNILIGKLESYLKAAFFGGQTGKNDTPVFHNYISKNGKKYVLCKNISYNKTKLGLLSILWRASISKNDFFKNTKLSPIQGEELRLMILYNDPGEINKYPIVSLSIIEPNHVYTEIIAEPRTFKHNKGSGYSILIGGIFFLVYLDHSFTTTELSKYSISPNKTMPIMQVEDNDGLDWILSYIGL